MTTEIEPQSLQKLSHKSVKRALDLFSPARDQLAPPDPERLNPSFDCDLSEFVKRIDDSSLSCSKKVRLSHKVKKISFLYVVFLFSSLFK